MAALTENQKDFIKFAIPDKDTAQALIDRVKSYVLTLDIADLSAEASYYLVAPLAGRISKIYSVIDGAVATADVTITAKIATVAVTGGVVTIATAGSAAGDVDSATPTAANTVTAGQAIEFLVTGGGAGGTPRGHLSVVIDY